MNRLANPRTQVVLIKDFLKSKGTDATHAEVRELVARLNGAGNWNKMLAAHLLDKTVSQSGATKPTPGDSLLMSLTKGIDALDSCSIEDIEQVEAQLNRLSESIARAKAATREQRLASGEGVLKLTVPLNDTIEDVWSYCREHLEFPLSVALLDAIKKEGEIVEAESFYPDARQYGMPATANMGIFETMLKADGWTVPKEANLTACDTKDDTGEYARIYVRVPKGLYEVVTNTFTR